MPADNLPPAARDALLAAANELDRQAGMWVREPERREALGYAAAWLRSRAGAPPAGEPEALEWRSFREARGDGLITFPRPGCVLTVVEVAPAEYEAEVACDVGRWDLGVAEGHDTLEAAQEAAERLWRKAAPLIVGLEGGEDGR